MGSLDGSIDFILVFVVLLVLRTTNMLEFAIVDVQLLIVTGKILLSKRGEDVWVVAGNRHFCVCMCVCVCVCVTHVKVKTRCLHVMHLHQPVESMSVYSLSVGQMEGCQISAILQGVFTPILYWC